MASKLQLAYDTAAATVYAIVRNQDGEVWNGAAFEAYVTANLGTYDLPMTEQGTASRYYTVTMPTVVLGTYSVAIYLQAGGAPAETDTLLTGGSVEYTGSAFETPQTGDVYALANGASGFVATKTAVDNIAIATNAGDLASKTADDGTLTTGSNTSGSYTDTASDNDTHWITAPVTPAVGGFGLRQTLRFDLELGRVPTSFGLRGWWNGSGATADIYAYNARTAVYDKMTNTGTNLTSRSTETVYSLTLPRDYADDSDGLNNIVRIEVRSASTNTGHRMRVDRALCYHVDEEATFTSTAPSVAEIWSAPSRTLSEPGVEPATPPTVEEIAAQITSDHGSGSYLTADVSDLPTNAELTTALSDLPTNAELTTALSDLPTNAELATALGTADDATLAAIAALNNLSAAQVNAEVDTAITDAALATAASLAAVAADLPSRITKNTALAAFSFVMVSSSDHVTPTASLTVTATRSLDGGAFAACANAVSEIGSGWYKIDLAAADLNGDVVALKFTATGADACNLTIPTNPT
jgi:hypothetical protein